MKNRFYLYLPYLHVNHKKALFYFPTLATTSIIHLIGLLKIFVSLFTSESADK